MSLRKGGKGYNSARNVGSASRLEESKDPKELLNSLVLDGSTTTVLSVPIQRDVSKRFSEKELLKVC